MKHVKIVFLCIMTLMLMGCNLYKELVIGGLEPATEEDIESRKDLTVRYIGEELGLNIDRDLIHVANGERQGDWYSFGFGDRDKAFGILVNYQAKEKRYRVEYDKQTYEVRQQFIDYMGTIRKSNIVFNRYVNFFPRGFDTSWYKNEVINPQLSYFVVIEDFNDVLPNQRKEYFKFHFEVEYLIVEKARDIFRDFKKTADATLGWFNVKYIILNDTDIELFLEQGDQLSDYFVSLDRSSVPSAILNRSLTYNNGNPATVVCELEILLKDTLGGGYITGIDSESDFVAKCMNTAKFNF